MIDGGGGNLGKEELEVLHHSVFCVGLWASDSLLMVATRCNHACDGRLWGPWIALPIKSSCRAVIMCSTSGML